MISDKILIIEQQFLGGKTPSRLFVFAQLNLFHQQVVDLRTDFTGDLCEKELVVENFLDSNLLSPSNGC